MIIRKPFAFIVQRFKLLHFITILLCAYLGYSFWHVKSFFDEFVGNGYTTNIADVPGEYYNFLMVIVIIIILIFTIMVTLLFKKKKKDYYPYLLLTIFFTILLFYTLFLPGLLRNAELAKLESSTSLIVRGATSVLFYGTIISSVVLLLLAFGFDIRTGEFLNIKDEVNLDEEDSEEIELNIKNEDYKVKRLFRRYVREVKYYVIENKNIFRVLAIILGLIVLFFVGKFVLSLNRIVRVDQSFKYSNLSLTFNQSVLSTLDYGGNTISNDKIYLAVKVKVANNSNGMQTIAAEDFCLEIDNGCVYPKLDKSGKFLDLAKPYYGEKIGQKQNYEYVLVYELNENQTKAKYKIKILDSLVHKENELIAKYKEINLSPAYSSSVNNIQTASLGEEINLNKTPLLDTKIKVNNYELVDNYRYNYNYCYKEKCSSLKDYEKTDEINEQCENSIYYKKCTLSKNAIVASNGKTFITLDGSLELDNNASYVKFKLGSNDFFTDFAKIIYYIGEEKYISDVGEKTPKDNNEKLVLEVSSSVKRADKLYLVITVRDKSYTIKLRES